MRIEPLLFTVILVDAITAIVPNPASGGFVLNLRVSRFVTGADLSALIHRTPSRCLVVRIRRQPLFSSLFMRRLFFLRFYFLIRFRAGGLVVNRY